MSTEQQPVYIDTANACLRLGGRAVALTPKAFTVLVYLNEHPGRLITKEELLEAVWPGRFVTDAVLKVCIREIRKALEDQPRAPRFIETLHRRGYRWIAAIGGGEDAAPASVAPQSHTPISLIGRDEVLAQLHGWLDHALIGNRQVVFVSGEAGIGKTALVEAFVEQAANGGKRLLGHGQCIEQYSAGEPYFPVLEALGAICRQRGEQAVSLLTRYAPSWLAQLPWLSGSAGTEIARRDTLNPSHQRMLREMAEWLEALTAEAPLLLVLEDLHWSDLSSLDLVSMLARRRGVARLMLLVTYRPVEAILAGHPLNAVKQVLQVHGHCEALALNYLSAADVDTYLNRRFPAHTFPPPFSAFIYRRTEGNPLFLLNVVDYLVARSVLVACESGWALHCAIEDLDPGVPEGLRQMIERQVERQSPAEQVVLEAASVAGSEFNTTSVAAALQADPVETDACLVRLARGEQLIHDCGLQEWPDHTVSARYRFVHALYQNVLYHRQGAAQRLQSHQRVGAQLERAFVSRSAEVAAELALHFEQGRDYPKAIAYLRQAAAGAAARSANREAVGYLTRARAAAGQDAEAQMTLLQERGQVRRAMADMAGAAEDFLALASCAQTQAQLDRQAMALIYAALCLLWVDRRRCLAVSTQLEALALRLDDVRLRTHVRGLSAYMRFMWRGWRNEDAQACNRAVEAARQADDPVWLNLWLGRFSLFQILSSDYAAGSRSAEEAAGRALQNASTMEYLLAIFYWGWALLNLGEWGRMHAVLRHGIEVADMNDSDMGAVMHRLALASLLLETFDFETARELAQLALQRAQAAGLGYARLLASILLGRAYLGLAEYELAFQHLNDTRRGLARERVVMDLILRMPLYGALSEYWYRQKHYARARREANRLSALAARPDCVTYQALAQRALARIAMAEERWEEAEAALTPALRRLETAPAPLAQWRVYATAAEVHLHYGRNAEAQRYWAASRAVLAQLADSLNDVSELRRALLDAAPVQAIIGRCEAIP
ncbi:MAG: AAA family ATPase [Nitrococcus sp.]|nr:AAA family ATPase [Nitrococcus sp.]